MVDIFKRNNVLEFENIKLINGKQQPPNLNKLLAKAEFTNEEAVVRNCQNLQSSCCNSVLLFIEYTFKYVNENKNSDILQ